MGAAAAIGLGAAAGLIACLPVAAAFRSGRRELAWGMGAILASFVMLTVAILAVRFLAKEAVLAFGASSAIAFAAATCLVAALHRG